MWLRLRCPKAEYHFALPHHHLYLIIMSLAEVKASIQAMTIEERLEIAALIAHLNRAEDRDYQAELDKRMSSMDAGHKTGAAALEQLHDQLNRRGRRSPIQVLAQ